MASVFTKIINGELPCYKLHEDDLTLSFLSLDPIHLGHSLIVPKQEVNHWMDVPEETFLRVARNSLALGQAIYKATECSRVLTTTVGFEVHHYHLHLIPAWSAADLSFAKATRRSEAEMLSMQKKIVNHLKF